ncbi:NUDIX hydrolase [Streptomyces tanashiensis]|uniref:NUDIX hydrolase n=1 Tax=Streptomyces tanashiensis TaxID=67367 RepID=UPI00368B23D9
MRDTGSAGPGSGSEPRPAGASSPEPGSEPGPGPVSLPGSGAGSEAVRRRVARVVLLDPDDRILLMHGYEPDHPDDSWWFTPGGGLEGDETREEAALRELAEETGITEVELGPVLWKRYCSFPFDGRRWDQDEWYYLARTRGTEAAPRPQALTELETRSLAGLRWWTSAELSAARETVYPTRLAELLHTLLDEGPPSAPVVLAPEIV